MALGNEVQAAQMDVNRARLLVCMDRFAEAETLFLAARQVLSAQEKHVPVARLTSTWRRYTPGKGVTGRRWKLINARAPLSRTLAM